VKTGEEGQEGEKMRDKEETGERRRQVEEE
jgi:hypothetical protein